jgi:hypothetical protein
MVGSGGPWRGRPLDWYLSQFPMLQVWVAFTYSFPDTTPAPIENAQNAEGTVNLNG